MRSRRRVAADCPLHRRRFGLPPGRAKQALEGYPVDLDGEHDVVSIPRELHALAAAIEARMVAGGGLGGKPERGERCANRLSTLSCEARPRRATSGHSNDASPEA